MIHLAFELSPSWQTFLATLVCAALCFIGHLVQRSKWAAEHATIKAGLDMLLEGADRHEYGQHVLNEGRAVAKEKGLEHVFDAVVQSPDEKKPTTT